LARLQALLVRLVIKDFFRQLKRMVLLDIQAGDLPMTMAEQLFTSTNLDLELLGLIPLFRIMIFLAVLTLLVLTVAHTIVGL
jgi:hypothetical protein